MNPNHYLAVAIRYLLTHRPGWPTPRRSARRWSAAAIIDRVVDGLGRTLVEVPVGFKWFAPGLFDGSFCFGGEESAGASFLRRDGTVWTTDKDGPLLDLLAAEITARTGKDPGEHYRELTAEFGTPLYTRIDAPADARAEGAAEEAVARGGPGDGAGRRADHGEADPGAGQRRADRRPEGRRGERAAARKDSSTSSKPPSSDIVKPPKPPPPEGQDRRRIGGQPGHPKHERAAFPPESINGGSFDHRLDGCPSCGQDLRPMRTVAAAGGPAGRRP